jgi:hypothetical protein
LKSGLGDLEQMRSSMDGALGRMNAIYDEQAKQIDGLIALWKTYEKQHADNVDRADIAHLYQYVLLNEKACRSLDLIDTQSTLDLFYVAFKALFFVAENIDKQLANTMTKEEAQSAIRTEVEGVGRFILRRISAREEETKRRWIQGNLGRGGPK